jgi:chromosomal replication initiation ATPase DnaA
LRKLKEEQERKEKERRILEALSNRRRDYLVVDSTYMDDPEMVKTLDEEKLFWKMAHQYIVGNSIPDNLRRIVAEVCLKHQIRLIEVLSDRRTSNIIPVRFEMIYRIKSETTWSLPRIGRFMGGRDHTTILHACRTFQKWLDEGKVKL